MNREVIWGLLWMWMICLEKGYRGGGAEMEAQALGTDTKTGQTPGTVDMKAT